MVVPTQEVVSVTVHTVINASAERLYRAFTSRAELNSWFCNNSFVNAQEGGRYLFLWNQEDYSATGQFKKLIENEKIVLSWRSTWQGQESDHAETFKVKFKDAENGTKVVIYHEGMAEDGKESYEQQWSSRLEDLKLYIETGARPDVAKRVIIGIFPAPLSEELAEELGLEVGSYNRVGNVIPDMGAAKAGIQIDDIITHMNGQAITTDSPMNVLVTGKKPGDEIEVTLLRDGETLTLQMPLSAYPVPDMPESFKALADQLAPRYDTLMQQLHDAYSDATDTQANQRPEEGEWSANLTLAHLIYSERFVHEQIGGHMTSRMPQHWSGNSDGRLQAIIDANPTVKAMLATMRREFDETLALYRNYPEAIAEGNKGHLWHVTFGAQGWIQHVESHLGQISGAIKVAQS